MLENPAEGNDGAPARSDRRGPGRRCDTERAVCGARIAKPSGGHIRAVRRVSHSGSVSAATSTNTMSPQKKRGALANPSRGSDHRHEHFELR